MNPLRIARRFAPLLLALCLPGVIRAAEDESTSNTAGVEFFESKIRPMLVKHCYECHSAEADEIEGGLALDSAAAILTGGDSGAALVPGKPAESLLLDALNYGDIEMPPDGRLPKEVIADFEKWIEMGAPDPRQGGGAPQVIRREIDIEEGRKFWAFQPVQQRDPPATMNKTWARNSIDPFVLAKLEEAKLQPSPYAARATLIRRLYFDLIGLPPTAEELEAALRDESPQAIERLVDRLLASEQFGVHWGRKWLDVARYADSNGGDFNATFHNAWRYRDYVVAAMNNDKPYDQFVREQIAGDLLPYADDQQHTEQLVASGFLMLGTKMLSERDKKKLQMDVIDEQIDTLGRTFMGMTLGCARCHDHKFDPIPTRDYYALAGIFRSTRTIEGESQKYVSTWRKSELPATKEQVDRLAKHTSEVKALKSKISAAKKKLATAESELAKKLKGTNHLTVDNSDAEVAGAWKSSTYFPLFVGKGYLHDDDADKGEKTVEFRASVPKSGTYEVRLSYTPGDTRASNVPVVVRHADGETEVAFDQRPQPPIDKMFGVVGKFKFAKETPASVTIFTTGTKGFVIADAVQFVELDEQGKPVASATVADGEQQKLKAEIEAMKESIKGLGEQLKKTEDNAPPSLPRAIAASDFDQADDCEICIRGEHRNLGDKIPRGFLQVTMSASEPRPKFSQKQSGRRELADWIANRNHPLTGRVIVNRVWSHLFGEGIVRSVDNFGALGERPTHPELLDHLTYRFVTSAEGETKGFGWSIKQLVREIVLSRAYQMSSQHQDVSWQKDPENRLLWRANRRRLPAEAIRDSMLAISGSLDLSPGGSPVEGLGVLVNNNQADAQEYQGKEVNKRSFYLPIIRNQLPPILSVFDFADPDLVVGKRPVTNVPAQALLLMNSPFVMDSAQRTAQRLLEDESQNAHAFVDAVYRTVLSRPPTEIEQQRAIAFLGVEPDGLISAAGDDAQKKAARFIHVLLASTEFRMLD